jgi:urease accessory protein
VLVLLTPAGAFFGGDAPRLDVWCEPGVDVTIASAAATKLNRCDQSPISFELDVHVAHGATFRYLPYELIPFRGTRYLQKIRLDLEGDACAWLLEIIGPGASAEPFTYRGLELETQVRHEDVIVVRERFSMAPSNVAQLRGLTHYGGLLTFGSEAAEEINARLACVPRGSVAGASALPGRGVGLKMLGHSAQTVRETLLEAAEAPRWLRAVVPP